MNNRKIVKQKAIINPIKLKVKTNNKKIENPKIKKYSNFQKQIAIQMRKKNTNNSDEYTKKIKKKFC